MSLVWKCAFFGWLATITVLSLIPHPPVPHQGFLGWDKFQHAAAYGTLTFLGAMAFPRPRWSRGGSYSAAALLAVVVGGMMELAQWGFTTSRSAEWSDLLADGVGSAAVAGLGCLVAVFRGNDGGKG